MVKKERLVFTFGRFNPPTTGHFELVKAVAEEAKKDGSDFIIVPSHKKNNTDNPLPFDVKVRYMKHMFFKYRDHIYDGDDLKTAFKVCEHYQGQYYDICMVVGSDRVEAFSKRLIAANGKTHTFRKIEVKSPPGLKRVTNSSQKKLEDYDIFDDTSTMSGSLMRKFAENVMTQQFLLGTRGLLNTWDSLELMAEVRKHIGK
mgnify:CR=1 FL=1|tara:strand:- start:164 stop:766 length:603 start_codon:yes stop_codon:yes gene_type:complete